MGRLSDALNSRNNKRDKDLGIDYYLKDGANHTYVMYDGKYYKIGKSKNPEKRLQDMKTANPSIRLLFYGYGIKERELHTLMRHRRIDREWFDLNESDLSRCRELILRGKTKSKKTLDVVEREKSKYHSFKLSKGKLKGKYICEITDINVLVDLMFTTGPKHVLTKFAERRLKELKINKKLR